MRIRLLYSTNYIKIILGILMRNFYVKKLLKN